MHLNYGANQQMERLFTWFIFCATHVNAQLQMLSYAVDAVVVVDAFVFENFQLSIIYMSSIIQQLEVYAI